MSNTSPRFKSLDAELRHYREMLRRAVMNPDPDKQQALIEIYTTKVANVRTRALLLGIQLED
ncbi:hypothetical protein [Vreelandella venusta]|uniref:hypothetical protein n=1 Tax=Vreelandella venusta TaxID=44935 RepID=UPI001170FE35|nr:hypothetical protein [Halomonas venusta]GEK52375.1 hypothetical protein HVE01_30960 [Halomonas venusta]